MYVDIVFPAKNEVRFIHVASLLGYDGICLAYSTKEFSQKKIDELQLNSPIKIYGAIKTTKTNKKTKTNIIISEAKDEKYNRNILEKGKINIIFNIENQTGQDFIHHRNSGLNHIICKAASESNSAIGVSFSNLLNQKSKSRLIGRINQNISLCKKYKTKIVLASFAKDPSELRSPTDLRSFLISIGTNNLVAKEALTNLSEIIEGNKTKITKDIKLEWKRN